VWLLHAFAWSPFYFWRFFLEGAHVGRFLLLFLEIVLEGALVERFLLSILGVDHILSCGVLHLLGILHIHPWSWLPWDSHMWIGCMHLVDLLLFLEEVVMEHSPRRIIIFLFSHASWRVHLVSSPRWTLEHILLCGELFYYILHACILGGRIPCGHLAFDLVWCLFLVVRPLHEHYLVHTLSIFRWGELLGEVMSTCLTWSTMD
jgi:hypothetical protein